MCVLTPSLPFMVTTFSRILFSLLPISSHLSLVPFFNVPSGDFHLSSHLPRKVIALFLKRFCLSLHFFPELRRFPCQTPCPPALDRGLPSELKFVLEIQVPGLLLVMAIVC